MPLLKLVEVGGVLLAGVAFAWWQLRDVRRAQQESERQRLQAGQAASTDPSPSSSKPTDDSREAR